MIYAINTISSEYIQDVEKSLFLGEGRFGWSSNIEDNLNTTNSLNNSKKNYFLLDLKENDYVVYINMPTYGECTLARVTGEYYFTNPSESSKDFNHRFSVDSKSIRKFSRNSSIVTPLLSSRLKLQGRYWRIYCEEDFYNLLEYLNSNRSHPENINTNQVLQLFDNKIENEFQAIARKLHEVSPNFFLEKVMTLIFRNTKRYVDIQTKHGLGDKGADIILTYEDEVFPSLVFQKKCLVQVKSYKGTMNASKNDALENLKNAFNEYNDADYGIIISTADPSEEFITKVNDFNHNSDKQVGLLCGPDLARFIIRNM